MNGSLDTNLLLRLITNDVPEQALKVKNLILTASSPIHVADAVFVEIEYALRVHYDFSRGAVYEVLLPLISSPSLNCNKPMLAKVLGLYKNLPGVSFFDIILSVYADLNNASPLWTFDKKMASQLPNTQLLK